MKNVRKYEIHYFMDKHCTTVSHRLPQSWTQIYQLQTCSPGLWSQTFVKEWVILKILSTVLTEFERGAFILNHPKSVFVSSILDIRQSAISGIIAKWNLLGTKVTQPWESRSYKVAKQSYWVLMLVVKLSHHQSADLTTSCGIIRTKTMHQSFMVFVAQYFCAHSVSQIHIVWEPSGKGNPSQSVEEQK